ncbi:hypothetical protein MicB006_2330 [Micromonospora sp. B006]|nr:hypothetical protein MicB006_2330 [Micromonospora sp. B006]
MQLAQGVGEPVVGGAPPLPGQLDGAAERVVAHPLGVQLGAHHAQEANGHGIGLIGYHARTLAIASDETGGRVGVVRPVEVAARG